VAQKGEGHSKSLLVMMGRDRRQVREKLSSSTKYLQWLNYEEFTWSMEIV
jgi:hypothetical protein